ncbi:hypothetical protein Q1695_012656 [Nippostrongylus brasiliensis]|nr:hypothetical protein Q1695_012656 [Nippostrongylus brasiliensis]
MHQGVHLDIGIRSKFEYFLLNGNLIERLEARSRAIGEALQRAAGVAVNSTAVATEERTRRRPKRIGAAGVDETKPRPKLFGGSLDEYVDATGEAIPLVVVSAITYLSRYSLRNQGLFRVSGSQSEINRFKDAYEKGDDAFADLTDGSESNSVAGVLKLYLRELREPLFPIFLFDQFTDCAKADSPQEFVRKAKQLVEKLPVSHILLLRFLFSFLSHLCEFADENMMEPHNMAICFGPTLLPIPEGKDQVFYHNFVNELVRNLIVHVGEVFPADLPGPAYDKYAAIAEDADHMGYMDEVDGLSEDEDCLRNGSGVSADSALAESTYDISTSIDMVRDATASTLQRETTPEEQSEPPSVSSRSSNRSNLDAYLRRMSEDVSPALRTEMPHLIANEVAAKFAAKERAAANARQATTREQERPSSNSSSNAPPPYSSHSPSTTATPSVNTSTSTMYGGSVPSAGVRLHPMTSLRDQLHHFRKELNSGREDTSRVYPMSEGLPCYPRRLGQPEANVLDARGGSEIPRHMEQYFGDVRPSTGERGSEPALMKTDQPDVVASARHSVRAQSELQKFRDRENVSPPLDELAAAALKATQFD